MTPPDGPVVTAADQDTVMARRTVVNCPHVLVAKRRDGFPKGESGACVDCIATALAAVTPAPTGADAVARVADAIWRASHQDCCGGRLPWGTEPPTQNWHRFRPEEAKRMHEDYLRMANAAIEALMTDTKEAS